MVNKINSRKNITDYASKTNNKKIAEDIKNFISEDKHRSVNPSVNASNIKMWKVILMVLSFFLGTIIFISILSMLLTDFK